MRARQVVLAKRGAETRRRTSWSRMSSDGGRAGTPTPTGPGPASLAKGTTWHSEPGLAMTGSGPGLARPAGSTLAPKHPCKRVKAKEPGRAEVEAAKAKEAEAKAEDSPRNRARQLRSRRLPHRPSLLLLLHRQLPSSLQHLPLTAPVAHPRKRASRRRHRL